MIGELMFALTVSGAWLGGLWLLDALMKPRRQRRRERRRLEAIEGTWKSWR